jgi:hypothetical protein
MPTPRASDGHGLCRHGEGGADLTTAMADLGTVDEGWWGVYAAAVARWEELLGRPVPDPTQPGKHGRPVLAPPFTPVPSLNRTKKSGACRRQRRPSCQRSQNG